METLENFSIPTKLDGYVDEALYEINPFGETQLNLYASKSLVYSRPVPSDLLAFVLLRSLEPSDLSS